SLLERLRSTDKEQAWARYVALYRPLFLSWAQKAGLSPEDAEDHVQDVFALLSQKMAGFSYDPRKGAFRAWLHTLFNNKLRDRRRRRSGAAVQAGQDQLDGLLDSDPVEAISREEHNRYLVRRALELMQAEFEPATWQACWEFVAEDRPAADVARS